MNAVIEALLREREHYQRRNLPDRVAAVTAELERLGYEATKAQPADAPETTALDAPTETTTPPRPRPRRRQPNGE